MARDNDLIGLPRGTEIEIQGLQWTRFNSQNLELDARPNKTKGTFMFLNQRNIHINFILFPVHPFHQV